LGAPDRQRATSSALARAKGRIDARTIFDIMRHHGEGYHPATAAVHSGVCIHAGPQKDRWWQADGVMVADVKPGDILVWVTGTSGNCVSIFKPVFMGVELPDIGPVPAETADARSLWWRHEQLHRRAMADFDAVVPEIRADFDSLEQSFLAEAPRVRSGTPALKSRFSEDCFRRAWQATEKWIARLAAREDLAFADPAYAAMWQKMNAAAGLTGLPAGH
jgi:dipeptidase